MSIGSEFTAERALARGARSASRGVNVAVRGGRPVRPRQKGDPRTRIVVGAWSLAVLAGPLLINLSWQLAYLLYALIGCAVLISAFLYRRPSVGAVPLLLAVQVFWICVLMAAHIRDTATLVNLASVAFGSVVIAAMMCYVPRDQAAVRAVFLRTRRVFLLLLIIGVFAGPLFAAVFGFSNPISDALHGQRMRIFSYKTGHSAVIECGVLFVMMGLSNIVKEKTPARLFWVGLGLVLVYLAKATIGYLVVLGIFYAFGVEFSRLNPLVKNSIHVISCFFAVVVLPVYGDQIVLKLREIQTGGRVSSVYYRGDLSAGRDELNKRLIQLANKNPLVGAGVTPRIIQMGVISEDGSRLSQTESGMRLSAKFGWPYLMVILGICLSPLLTLLTGNRSLRILGVSLAAYCAIVFAFNSIFELAHAWNTLAIQPLALLLGGYGWRARGKSG